MHGSQWATHKQLQLLPSSALAAADAQRNDRGDVIARRDTKVETSSSREALLSAWEQRCWGFIPAAALRAPEAACCCTSVIMSVCQTVLNRNYSFAPEWDFFFSLPPQDSLRALQRLKTSQNAATCFWWVFHLLLSSVSNPQKSQAPPDRISSLRFHRPAALCRNLRSCLLPCL